MMKLPRIIFACGREPTYVRNALLWRSLHGNFDSSLVSDARHGSLTFKLARVSLKLLKALSQPHDLVVIGFYGHPLMLLARRFSTCPIIFDPFVSTFDTLIADRNQIQQGSIFAQFLLQLDRKALQISNAIITDTDTNANFYAKEFQVARDKFTTLYVSCDERIFFPRSDKNDSNRFTVFTYSSYMPLHGMDVIVEAAKLCQELPICFRLVGNTGPQYQVVYEQAKKHNLNNI